MRLLHVLLLLFVVIPFVEVALLLRIADGIGGLNTFALVIVTGVIGSLLARSQGFRVWRQMQEDLSAGRMPTQSLADGAMILVAGAFLVTPGVLTDLFGLSLLIPIVRTVIRRGLASSFKANTNFQVHSSLGNSIPQPFAPGEGFGNNSISEDSAADIVDSYVVDDEAPDDEDPDGDAKTETR